jgi:hypothetical protein
MVWIETAGVAGTETRFSISVDDSRTTLNDLVQNPRKTPWLSAGFTGSENRGLLWNFRRSEAPFSVSLFFESPSCRKVSKINCVAINKFKTLTNLLRCK